MKSSSQLQREAEMTRQGLSDSLDGLRQAVTPSYLTTEMLNLAKDSSVSIARALAESARANPIPALLIGAGLVMMLTRASSAGSASAYRAPDAFDKAGWALKSAAETSLDAVRGTADSAQRTASDTARRAGDLASDTARRASDLASGTARRASDMASGVAQTVGSAAHTVGSTTRDTIAKAGDAASSVLASARDTAGRVQDQVRTTAEGLAQQGQQTARQLSGQAQRLTGDARNFVTNIAEEQPIVVAALGAAIGAALGAALPMTEAERQYLGSASARVTQAGRDTISKVAQVVKSETVGDNLGAKVDAITGKVVNTVSQELGRAD